MISILVTVAAFTVAALGSEELDPAAVQTSMSNVLTTSYGAPVSKCQATNTLNHSILRNPYLAELMSHLARERTPERAVHAKGTGAFGIFETTHDMSHICKASFLKKGEKTLVAVRLSTSAGHRGTSDMILDSKGFAVKFYTREGNFDMVGFSTPMFLSKEPLHGHTIVHSTSSRRHPSTNYMNSTMLWDFITLAPEALFMNLYLFSGRGHPASFRHIPGFSIHTYQFENEKGERFFGRFHFMPDEGIKTLDADEATQIGASDPDYFVLDLYQAIEEKNYPCWTLYLQVMSEDDVKKEGSKVFDVTRTISQKKYPLQEVGKLCLNKNPENWNAEIEQLAMCPCHVIPGIPGAPDKFFELRTMVYRDTIMHRLGVNYNQIYVNRPLRSLTYNRDGAPPLGDNGGDEVNYYPNSFNGPEPYEEKYCSRLLEIEEAKANNLDLARDFYAELDKEGREQLIKNMSKQLKSVNKFIQNKALELFKQVHEDLATRMAEALKTNNDN